MPLKNQNEKLRRANQTRSQDVLDRYLVAAEQLGEAELKEVRGGVHISPGALCW